MTGSTGSNGRPLPWLPIFWGVLVVAQITSCGPELWHNPWSIIQDDGRHFVAWLRQMSDPALFPDDPIATYFLALTPELFKALHLPAVWLDIDVGAWNLLVVSPLSIALFLAAANTFAARMQLARPERHALVLLLLAAVYSDVTSGLPRGFGPTIVLGLLGLFMARRRIALGIAMAAGANIYPIAALVSGGAIGFNAVLRSMSVRRIDRNDVILVLIAAAAGIVGLSPFLASTDGAGATFTLAEARDIPIFGPGGRTSFFRDSWVDMLLCSSQRSGLLPTCAGGPGWPPLVLTAAVFIMGALLLRRRDVPRDVGTALISLVLSGLVLTALAYVFAFKGHLPGRYSRLSLEQVYAFSWVFAVTSGIVWAARRTGLAERRLFAGLVVLLLAAALVGTRPSAEFIRDPAPLISAALRSQPPETVVAGFSRYVDSAPALTGRKVFVSLELTVPYKKPYYYRIEQKMADMGALYRGPVSSGWRALLDRSGIDFFILDSEASARARQWYVSFPVLKGSREQSVFVSNPDAVRSCTFEAQGSLKMISASCFADRALE
ncbi:hypothetical protein LZ190_20025 [Rhodovulum sulfidophilum]|nr:hypothetical protein [Rhodovulum sulfidophilum]